MTDRVRFVRQWTFKTKSDHKALFVKVTIRSSKLGAWRYLTLVTANMGGRFDALDLLSLIDKAEAAGAAVILLQEAGDQPYIRQAAQKEGWTYIGGKRPGESSTPMLISPEIKVHKSVWQQILGRVHVGPGAGPDTAKAKGWHRTRLSLHGIRFGASSFHEYASLGRRYVWGLRLAGPIAAAILRMGRPFFLCGDFNADNSQPLVRWLLKRGFTTNHRQLGEVATHGNRSIDAVAVQASMVARRG